jgi:hypothetical protein
MTDPRQLVNVRYLVDDVDAAVAFYTKHLETASRSRASSPSSL